MFRRSPSGAFPVRVAGFSVVLLGLAAAPAAAAAQEDSSRLVGRVSAAASGKPLAGVMVALRGTGLFQVTDSTGEFAIGGVPPGDYTLHISYRNRRSEEYEIGLLAGRTLEVVVLLDAQAVDLAPIVVEARAPHAALTLVGFYARRDKGFGMFVTREDIERRNPDALTSLLAGTGIRVVCRRGVCVPTVLAGARRCPLAVFLDGLWVKDFDLSWIPPRDVLGVEIYRHGPEVPVEFTRYAADCGAVIVWTRRR